MTNTEIDIKAIEDNEMQNVDDIVSFATTVGLKSYTLVLNRDGSCSHTWKGIELSHQTKGLYEVPRK